MSGEEIRKAKREGIKAFKSIGIDWGDKELMNVFPAESNVFFEGKKSGKLSDGEMFVAFLVRTMEANEYSHSVKAERLGQKLLRQHISKKQWESYFISGVFTEVSASGKYYIFRKGFPTILCERKEVKNKVLLKPKVALCGHVGLYTMGSFSGGLCPSDDVLTHLLSMRTDEASFLKSCNKHKFSRPQSGC